MAFNGYNGIAYPQNYYNGYNGGAPDQGNRFAGQYQQSAGFPLQAPAPVQQPSNGIIWVQGEEGAKAYMVAPGCSVPLWDSENTVIYIKSVDMSGMPSMKVLDYTERTATPRNPAVAANVPIGDFITRAEFSALEERLNELSERSRAVKTKSKEESESV